MPVDSGRALAKDLQTSQQAAARPTRLCAIYFFDGWIGVAPTVIGIAQALAKAGYQVTVYCRRTNYAATGDVGEGVTVEYIERSSSTLAKKLAVIRGVEELIRFRQGSRSAVNVQFPTIHIGVDQVGAIVGALAARSDGGPTIHLSLELADDSKPKNWLLSRLFRAAYRRTDCCVIQDQGRFDALSKVVHYTHPRVFFVPNAPAGSVVQSIGENFYRQRLQISEQQFPILVVHAGIVEDVAYSQELAAAFSEIDLGCALIFHERFTRDPDDPYLHRMRARNTRNLFFSLSPVPFESIDLVFASATIGLAFYRPVDANLALMAKASGKLAFHLKHGTPMIMNDLPSLVELNRMYEFGVTVRDPASSTELAAAVRFCMENYVRLSANARTCFEREFQLEGKIAPFLDFATKSYPP